MGSGHFLVDALDVLPTGSRPSSPSAPRPVRAVLSQLREMVQAQARDLPAGVLAEIRDVELLKRVVLKRSIYGVDLNPMAVELAKLALWLDAFVPGCRSPISTTTCVAGTGSSAWSATRC